MGIHIYEVQRTSNGTSSTLVEHIIIKLSKIKGEEFKKHLKINKNTTYQNL